MTNEAKKQAVKLYKALNGDNASAAIRALWALFPSTAAGAPMMVWGDLIYNRGDLSLNNFKKVFGI